MSIAICLSLVYWGETPWELTLHTKRGNWLAPDVEESDVGASQ